MVPAPGGFSTAPPPQPQQDGAPTANNESKTFSDNKAGDAESNKAYGTFKNPAPAPPVEQNNWTNMSQTTIILGSDGSASVQPGLAAPVSPVLLLFSPALVPDTGI